MLCANFVNIISWLIVGFPVLMDGSDIDYAGGCNSEIPLVIMTSDDTHAPTLNLLESNSYFGMKPTQVNLLKQVSLNISTLLLKSNSCFYMSDSLT